MQRMVTIHEHPARLPNRGWSESCSDPICRAEVKGDASDADRRAGIVAVNPEECRRNSESRDPGHSLLELLGVNKNTAAATTQVQSPRGAPWAAATMECVSTMRLLIS